jgi:hypothetical protein
MRPGVCFDETAKLAPTFAIGTEAAGVGLSVNPSGRPGQALTLPGPGRCHVFFPHLGWGPLDLKG